ncbi:hypothetical protein KAJ61_06110 [Candidatus Parcubacteria bacterium]|nr:hypothetical protein [Candidatus Parcubacteria bacterium]
MWIEIIKIISQVYSNPLSLNWLTLLITIIALVIVFFQTVYTKSALKEAQKSIELATVSRQLEVLPRSDYIIFVQTYLKRWRDELEYIVKYLEEKNDKEIKKISQKDIKAKGLLDYYFYKKMPGWLAVIYSTGVQYYYNSSCLYKYLYDTEKKESNGEDYLDRFKESIYYLKILSNYIDNEVPEVFLNCPASKNLNDFIKKDG